MLVSCVFKFFLFLVTHIYIISSFIKSDHQDIVLHFSINNISTTLPSTTIMFQNMAACSLHGTEGEYNSADVSV